MRIVFSTILIFLVFTLDLITPLGIAGGVPYVVFVLTGFWYEDKRVILVFGALAAILTVTGYHFSPDGGDHWKILLNRTYAMLAIGSITFLAYYSKSQRIKLEEEDNESSVENIGLESRVSLVTVSSIVGAAIVGMGILSIHLIERASENTQIMYNHPLVVSNAVRDLKIKIQTVEQLLEEIVVVESEEELRAVKLSLDNHSKEIHKCFNVASDRFLGNVKSVDFVRQAFSSLEELITAVVVLVEVGKIDAATRIIKTTGANQLTFMEDEIQKIIDVSSTKAAKLNEKSKEDNHNIKVLMSILIGVVLLFGIMAVFILDSSRVDRQKAQADLEKMNLFLEDKIQERTQDLLKALEHAKEVNAMKSRFVSMASHEFRTPLSAILSSASLISKYPKESQQDKREKHVNRIKSSVNILIETLTEFLSMDKLDQGKVTPLKEVFDLPLFCDELMKEVSQSKKEGQIVSYNHKGENKVRDLDQKMLRNILVNLLSNATKYSPKGYPIQLFTKVENKKVILQVKDQGIGIPEEDQQYLFEQFYRATNVTNTPGTGLGLNIVKYLAEMMGGKLSYTSEEGKGSTFVVTFPQR